MTGSHASRFTLPHSAPAHYSLLNLTDTQFRFRGISARFIGLVSVSPFIDGREKRAAIAPFSRPSTNGLCHDKPRQRGWGAVRTKLGIAQLLNGRFPIKKSHPCVPFTVPAALLRGRRAWGVYWGKQGLIDQWAGLQLIAATCGMDAASCGTPPRPPLTGNPSFFPLQCLTMIGCLPLSPSHTCRLPPFIFYFSSLATSLRAFVMPSNLLRSASDMARLLVVDDNVSLLFSLCEFLEQQRVGRTAISPKRPRRALGDLIAALLKTALLHQRREVMSRRTIYCSVKVGLTGGRVRLPPNSFGAAGALPSLFHPSIFPRQNTTVPEVIWKMENGFYRLYFPFSIAEKEATNQCFIRDVSFKFRYWD